MRFGLFIGFVLITFIASSFHIVGGEIEFITISPGRYRINVIQYFDRAQVGNPGPEAGVEVFIFSNKDNRFVSRHLLTFFNEQIVQYTNPDCSIGQLQTSRVVWTEVFDLNPENYADEEGYYIVWERCCRNEAMINIVNPLGTGMKYVTEIPPLWKDNQPFINSSPILFEPLSDYACINQLYYVEFTGVDPDGDSLVYSLTNPLNSSASVAVPVPQPKPHPEVFFESSFSVNNMIPGSPALNISAKGLLTVSPSARGLYVFSVLVEEYRNGIKIGQVQRDFQMLVIDGCEPPDPPVVAVNIPGRPDFQFELDTIKYELTDDKCFEFIIKNITPGETINLRAQGVNFDADINSIFSFRQALIGANMESLVVEVCAPGCPPVRDVPFIVDLIAGDDACPLPQLDTLRLMILVEPPPNSFPVTVPGNQTITIQEDELYLFDFISTDADGDSLQVLFYIPGVDDPAQFGFSLTESANEPGRIEAQLRWDTDCLNYDFSENQYFAVGIYVEDKDECSVPNPTITWLNLTVELPSNNNPVVAIPALSGTTITIQPDQEISFSVNATDVDNDELDLFMIGEGFNPAAFQVQFNNVSGTGSVSSNFRWFVDCNFTVPDQENRFTFLFIADDFDKCKVKNYDTLAVTVIVETPVNNQPLFEPVIDYVLDVNIPFELPLSATDPDLLDLIVIGFSPSTLLPNSPSLNLSATAGFGSVSALFSWTPECTLLDGEKSKDFDFTFRVSDDRCPINLNDEVTVRLTVVESRDRFGVFRPANAFSPNKDGNNDVFAMTGYNDPAFNLPIDICEDEFQFISIHDRTGKKIYYSENRDFRWDGEKFPSGVYFYVVQYTITTYKNYVQLLR